MPQQQDATTAAQDAVVAFVSLVRAVKTGDRDWQRREAAVLERCGIKVRVRRENAIVAGRVSA